MSGAFHLGDLESRLLQLDADLRFLSAEQQFTRIMSRVADSSGAVVTPDDLLERLRASKASGKALRVKFGIDPTAPDIHLGHAVPLLNLRLFQRMGHDVVLVIGDFTGMVGDPSGRVEARPPLSEADIRSHMATYEEQASKILEVRAAAVERRWNSEWMGRLTMRQWVEIIKRIPANALLQREDFRTRLAGGHGLSMAELEYALFMAYDSVVLNPDVEIGGADQYLNLHMCRQMMANAGQRPEVVVTYNLLAGTTGERDAQGRLVKMSKSKGNDVPITADPAELYGKAMSIPDEVMWSWYRELTDIAPEDLSGLKASVERQETHPKEAKHLLARVLVGTFNRFDLQVVGAAERDFQSKFGTRAALVPDGTQVAKTEPSQPLIDALAQIAKKSKSEIRRLVRQRGIDVLRDAAYAPLTIEELALPSRALKGHVVRIGKRLYCKLE